MPHTQYYLSKNDTYAILLVRFNTYAISHDCFFYIRNITCPKRYRYAVLPPWALYYFSKRMIIAVFLAGWKKSVFGVLWSKQLKIIICNSKQLVNITTTICFRNSIWSLDVSFDFQVDDINNMSDNLFYVLKFITFRNIMNTRIKHFLGQIIRKPFLILK